MSPLTSSHTQELTADNETRELPVQMEAEVYYVGTRTSLGPAVLVESGADEVPLAIADASRGYSWGTVGSRPVELARGILLDATGDAHLAEELSKAFTWEVVGALPPNYFRLARSEVLAWVGDFRSEFPHRR